MIFVAEAEIRSKETGTAEPANQQEAKTLKLHREEHWDEFYKRQHGRGRAATARSRKD